MESNTQTVEIDLGAVLWSFITKIKKTWWLIPVLAILFGIFGYMKSLSIFYTPMYQATASFTVLTGDVNEETGAQSYNFYYNTSTAGQLAKTFPYILSSNLLTDAIKEDLNVETINGSITASTVSDSNLITMTVISNDADDALQILESVLRVYPEVSRFVIGDTHFNMIDPPSKATEPYNQPNYIRNIGDWVLIGVAVAMGILLLWALFSKTVQTPDELKSVISLKCLGNLPEIRFKARSKGVQHNISVLEHEVSPVLKENMFSLSVHIAQEMEEKNAKVLLVSSTVMGEGKTSVALNLAYVAASQGKKVIFIDGDLRKQNTRARITKQSGYGLGDMIFEHHSLEEALQQEPHSGVWLLCGQQAVSDVPKVLNGPEMQQILDACRKMADLVIIDTPPCGLFEDAGIFATYADSILYIVRHDYIQRHKILDGISNLEDTGVPIIGYVFNSVPVHNGRGYGRYGAYRYGRYGYGHYGYGSYGYGHYMVLMEMRKGGILNRRNQND